MEKLLALTGLRKVKEVDLSAVERKERRRKQRISKKKVDGPTKNLDGKTRAARCSLNN